MVLRMPYIIRNCWIEIMHFLQILAKYAVLETLREPLGTSEIHRYYSALQNYV